MEEEEAGLSDEDFLCFAAGSWPSRSSPPDRAEAVAEEEEDEEGQEGEEVEEDDEEEANNLFRVPPLNMALMSSQAKTIS